LKKILYQNESEDAISYQKKDKKNRKGLLGWWKKGEGGISLSMGFIEFRKQKSLRETDEISCNGLIFAFKSDKIENTDQSGA